MRLVRSILLLNRIYTRQTATAVFYWCVYGFVLLAVISWRPFSWRLEAMVALSVLVLGLLLRSYVLYRIIETRLKPISAIELARQTGSHIQTSAASTELNGVDGIHVLRQSADWSVYDTVFDFYRRTKNGQYLSKQVFYTVFEMRLSRVVPHLVFDARNAKRRQFKYVYLQSQRLSLEGNFDTYFDTYAPDHYQIDVLSFITPEVMEALLAARRYDIELVENSLLLYAPLLDLAELPGFEMVGRDIARHINDNIDTYRDSYGTTQGRAITVTPFGRQLLRSPMKFVPGLIASALAFGALGVYASAIDPRVFLSQPALLVYIFFVTHVVSIVKIVRFNKRQRWLFANDQAVLARRRQPITYRRGSGQAD